MYKTHDEKLVFLEAEKFCVLPSFQYKVCLLCGNHIRSNRTFCHGIDGCFVHHNLSNGGHETLYKDKVIDLLTAYKSVEYRKTEIARNLWRYMGSLIKKSKLMTELAFRRNRRSHE